MNLLAAWETYEQTTIIENSASREVLRSEEEWFNEPHPRKRFRDVA